MLENVYLFKLKKTDDAYCYDCYLALLNCCAK